MNAVLLAALVTFAAVSSKAQENYGSKGIYPVYEQSGTWLIYNKAARGKSPALKPGRKFLVIGGLGAGLFTVERTSMTYGGACRARKPIPLPAAILDGARAGVGRPVIGVSVPASFTLKGSKARTRSLSNQVSEDSYRVLGDALKEATLSDIKSGDYPFGLDENPPIGFSENPQPEKVSSKIDFAARVEVKGLSDAFVLVEGTQVLSSYRRCLRVADGGKLIGGCAEMPHVLMAETSLLEFALYDPSGKGTVYLLASSSAKPLWGEERWALAVNKSGPRLFLRDAMDPRCRESF